MALTRIESDTHVAGNLSANTMTYPAGSITNVDVGSGASIATTKLQHRHSRTYSQESATSAADESRVLFTAYGATGTVISFKAGAVVAAVGAATCAVNLKKNGTSILSAALSLTSSQTAYAELTATISTASIVAGDNLEVSIDGEANGGTLAKGVYCTLVVDETAS